MDPTVVNTNKPIYICQHVLSNNTSDEDSLIIKLKVEYQGDNRGMAIETINKIGKIKSHKAVNYLIDIFNREEIKYNRDYNPSEIGVAIIDALGNIKDNRSVPLLKWALKYSSRNDVRARAIVALGEMSDPECVNLFIDAYKNGDTYEIKEQAVNALVKSNDKKALIIFISQLNSPPNFDSKADLVEKIRKMYDHSVKKHDIDGMVMLLDVQRIYWKDEIIDELVKLKAKKASAKLVKVLMSTDDERLMGKIAWALGYLGDNKSVESLFSSFYTAENNQTKFNAAISLVRLGDGRGSSYLIDIYNKYDSKDSAETRKFIIEVLGNIKQINLIGFFIDVMLNGDDKFKNSAEDALRKLKKEIIFNKSISLEHLILLCKHKPMSDQWDVASAALSGMFLRNDPSAIDYYLEIMRSPDYSIKKKKMVFNYFLYSEKMDQRIIPALVSQIKSGMLKPESIDLMSNIMSKLNKNMFYNSVPVYLLTDLLQLDEFRDQVVDILAKKGDGRAVFALIRMLKDQKISRKTRILIEQAIGKLDYRALNTILSALDDNDRELRISAVRCLVVIALRSNQSVKKEIADKIADRMGLGLFGKQKESDSEVLELMRLAYQKVMANTAEK